MDRPVRSGSTAAISGLLLAGACLAGGLQCAGSDVTIRTPRRVTLPGSRSAQTVYDARHLLRGGPHRGVNEQSLRAALAGDWKAAYISWVAHTDCASLNNAAVAAAVLGERKRAIELVSRAAHRCPDTETIRENARVIFTDGIPLFPPKVELSPGAGEQPRSEALLYQGKQI